jgi:hypothetical protein
LLVVAHWQARFPLARFDLIWLARMALLLPPWLVVLSLAGTTRFPG